jgi:integrase
VPQARRVLRAARSPRELARLTCALVLGIRQGEALGLQWEAVAIDKDGGVIEIGYSLQRVKGESILDTPKSRASRRQIPVPATVARALLPYLW